MKQPKELGEKYAVLVNQNHQHLIEHQDSILKDLPWEINVIERLQVGFDGKRKCFVFPVFDEDGQLLNIYWHKGKNHPPKLIAGAPAKLLYPLPLIVGYPKKESLIYCEGLKDSVTLLSKGINVASHLGGAKSIPDNLTPLIGFDRVVLVFDNDQDGNKATFKLATRLLQGE